MQICRILGPEQCPCDMCDHQRKEKMLISDLTHVLLGDSYAAELLKFAFAKQKLDGTLKEGWFSKVLGDKLNLYV